MENENKKTNQPKKEQRYEIGTRGRFIEGTVVKKFPNRIVIEYQRTVFVKKYERFYSKTSRVHARLPANFHVEIGDYVKVQECRPLSKIIHHIFVEKIRSADVKGEEK